MINNCSFDSVDNLMRYSELIIYIPIFLIGMIVNFTALVLFCACFPKWTESAIYMTSLALMDLLLLLPLPFKMHAAYHTWDKHLLPLCLVLENLYFVGIYGSIYMIMCIAMDRWVSICYPFRSKQLRSPKVAVMICIGVWLLVFAAIFPVTYNFGENRQEKFHCFHGFSKKGWSPGVIICLQVFGFLGPALVIICCSIHNIGTLKQSGQHSAQSRACVKIIYSSLGAFLVPFTPSHLGIFLQFLVHQGMIQDCDTKKHISMFIQISMCLSNITCCLDAFCYYFIAREMRSPRQMLTNRNSRRTTFSTSEIHDGCAL
ncbi:G-protein coupled receptor 55 [Melanotaenia boesemani]|uniref:G-protein coupled receptor 55 n=1 Tax=Melanotaenia boesemani TaxID=1250792 RepID=UPI001C04FA7C|nr:G-protein coupled receptor 55 [Melanotaenia boesemani]